MLGRTLALILLALSLIACRPAPQRVVSGVESPVAHQLWLAWDHRDPVGIVHTFSDDTAPTVAQAAGIVTTVPKGHGWVSTYQSPDGTELNFYYLVPEQGPTVGVIVTVRKGKVVDLE